jgi:hypothetical protein
MAFDSPHLIPKCQDHPFQTPLSARSEPSRRRVDLASRMQSICQPQLPAMTEIGGIPNGICHLPIAGQWNGTECF